MSRSKTKSQPVPDPVARVDVFKTFIEQGASLANEVTARRVFDEDVAAFLKERDLVEVFEAFQAKRHPDYGT